MTKVYAIALNAYREAVRDRVLLGVLGLAGLSLIFGAVLAWISLDEQVRILLDHGLVTISWLANLVAIFLGASFLYKEIELRTLYVILSKPMPRWQFVLGKYFGILATAAVFVLTTGGLLCLLLDFQVAESQQAGGVGLGSTIAKALVASRGQRVVGVLGALGLVALGMGWLRSHPRVARWRRQLGAAVWLGLAALFCALSATLSGAVAPEETKFVLWGCALVLGEVAITAAAGLFFSAFSTPFVTALMTFGLFLIGRSTGTMLELRSNAIPPELRLLKRIAVVLPNLHLYVPERTALLGGSSTAVWSYVFQALVYSVVYSTLLLMGATALFRKRELG